MRPPKRLCTDSTRNKVVQVLSSKHGAQHVLQDVIDNICEYLNYEDLKQVGQVCKSWNAASMRERRKRIANPRIEQITINCSVGENQAFQFPIGLRNKPFMGFLFLKSSLFTKVSSIDGNLANEITRYYIRQLSCPIIPIEVTDFVTDGTITLNKSDEEKNSDFTSATTNGAVGLFLPKTDRLKYNISCLGDPKISEWSQAVTVIRTLDLSILPTRPNSAILFFGKDSYGRRVGSFLTMGYRRNIKTMGSCETIWGGMFRPQGRPLAGMESYDSLIALLITGPSFQSWGITMHCRRPKENFDQQLIDFKKKINRKRFTFGLVYGPSNLPTGKNMYQNKSELMAAIKNVFNDIPITAFFTSDSEVIYDSTIMVPDLEDDTDDDTLNIDGVLSMIIMSYN